MQEAFSRMARTDIASIDDPEGWLVVVTSRLCLDRLRTRRRRPTDALDLFDDPFDAHALDPSNQITLVDNVTLAMHALLERLSPAERTSFVLHDVFQYPFEESRDVVGRTARRRAANWPVGPAGPCSRVGDRPIPRGLCATSTGE